MNQKTLITILAVIGGIVVLGWVLKLAVKLFIPLLLIGVGVAVYLAVQDNKRIGGPK